MKNINPLVSVIIPSYNGLPFLKDAIKSVLEQTYKNFELIIVDDSSEDNTYGYISLGLYFMYIVKKLVSLYKESTDGTMKGGMRKQNAKKK